MTAGRCAIFLLPGADKLGAPEQLEHRPDHLARCDSATGPLLPRGRNAVDELSGARPDHTVSIPRQSQGL